MRAFILSCAVVILLSLLYADTLQGEEDPPASLSFVEVAPVLVKTCFGAVGGDVLHMASERAGCNVLFGGPNASLEFQDLCAVHSFEIFYVNRGPSGVVGSLFIR